MTKPAPRVQMRDLLFSGRIISRIWQEEPAEENPYLAENCRCHGYDLLELLKQRSFMDVLYLLFSGELPSKDQKDLLEIIFIALINPGPRHPAARAAMNAGVGRTDPAHMLPIALGVLGGEHLGGGEVEASMRFLRKSLKEEPQRCAAELLKTASQPPQGDWHPAPGFGSRFGGIDPLPQKIAAICGEQPGSGEAIHWGNALAEELRRHNLGWLSTGIAAAALCDLGFHPRAGAGLFQIMSAPGILAHGLEFSNKPITAMPFPDKEHYVIAPEARRTKK